MWPIRSAKIREFIWVLIIALLIVGIGMINPKQCQAQEIPAAAHKHRADLVRAAHLAWGLDAPIATMAAQVHQESGWNPSAVSRVGAKGLAQFMPATADWIGGIEPELAARQPDNPVWALRALVTYDKWLWDRMVAVTPCDRMAMVLSGYNGGAGWVQRDKALAARAGDDRNRWWGSVEHYNAGRSAAAWQENRGYPVRILRVLEPRYAAWGKGSCA